MLHHRQGASGRQHLIHIVVTYRQVGGAARRHVGGHRIEGDRPLTEGVEIERETVTAGAPQPVDVHQIAALDEAQRVEEMRAAGELGNDVVATTGLPAQVGEQGSRAGRDTDGKIKGEIATLDEGIEDTAGKDAAHSPSLDDDGRQGAVGHSWLPR